MKTIVVPILLIFCTIQIAYSQLEDGVIALDIPVRNSLMFNRFELNPTFSFVREQNKYITVTNKREFVQVEDAPQTYLFNYAGRFRENIGAGIGVFQQNYGVFTNYGGLVNFAYNIRLEEESNLTFGMNVGAYKSGLNSGNIVTNFEDPALANIPSNFLLTINPGLNYGAGFMDFGVSLNNAVTYNFESSGLLEENPKQAIQGHIMYTGYFGGYGFLGDSRFSALARSEFQKEASIHSGVLMLTVPKGIWAQVGYNNLYGASGGLGVNITPQIAIEYNYERPLSGLSNLGSAHEITLAYRFKNDNYYDYSRDDEIAGVFSLEKKPKKKPSTKKAITETIKEPETPTILEPEKVVVDIEAQERLVAEEQAKQEAKAQAKLKDEEQARLAAEEQARLEAEKQARLVLEEQARLATATRARLEAEEQAKLKAEEQLRLANEEKARLETAAQAKLATEEQARLKAEEETRLAAEEQARFLAEKNSTERLIKNPTDEIGTSISTLAAQTKVSKIAQTQLLAKLETAIATKENDLKDLKEENDLSEQDIYVEPKPFKSISEENKAIETYIIQLDTTIIRNNKRIVQLESLLEKRVKFTNNQNDATNLYYQNALTELKSEQDAAKRSRESLLSSLERINIATDFERKRRIKRAAYDNDQDRYLQDRARLKSLRQTVSFSESPLVKEDFDFGQERSNNIRILKNVENTVNAYYLVLAVHSNVGKRDEFLTKVISSGYRDVDFFYDVNTSEYYIYTKKFNDIQEANEAIKTKEDKVYNEKISIIKIEN